MGGRQKQAERDKLTEDEITEQDAEELPAREVMSLLALDPTPQPPPILPLEGHHTIDPAPPPGTDE
jgi:hypothetical protein